MAVRGLADRADTISGHFEASVEKLVSEYRASNNNRAGGD